MPFRPSRDPERTYPDDICSCFNPDGNRQQRFNPGRPLQYQRFYYLLSFPGRNGKALVAG